ncbi:MAG: tRNA (N6-isopentenyl adenosine(37)-C2)-methylthiotransferase MiaB [Lentisphaerae bacterium RIFOXYB12_FULL_65_16]|nr:MAG: tRNA (N6-isopentenyl adenosine(37)-C2)-methylthiotransferase MiaB [Lentisphaerae bacterium RIFOXYA12_64_32]OGV84269.1 MAG: tRNA (N6-isopentenyl adenosine(37)-C2)-methylthiotransferase MiaB [Lentisphaerae bacterium RIFOXYB12_FULL_65_16]
MLKTFHIRTYGCQMNERDSEALGCLLEEHGYTLAPGEETADILIFNTCSVRDQAERKVFGKVGLTKRLRRQRPEVIIGVIGCMAQEHGAALLERFAHLDFVVGTDQLHTVPGIVAEIARERSRRVATETGADDTEALSGHRPGAVSAFVSVMRGCNQFCSYCVVPQVRGRERSRLPEDVVREVRQLAGQGTKEIFLLGQNITAYGIAEARRDGTYSPDASPFADLLRAVNDVPGVERIRFTSPHPKFMNQAFLDAVCELPKVCKAFHIPLQSGADRILELMHRGTTAKEYLARIRHLRERLPEVGFSTDIIVGFPTETDVEFAATRQAMNEAGFDMAYIFKYSPRPGTKAAEKLPDDVPQSVKEERNQILLADLVARAESANTRYQGRTVRVLVEGESKRNSTRWTGRSDTNKVCIFPRTDGMQPGDLVDVVITRTTANSLFGCVAEEA